MNYARQMTVSLAVSVLLVGGAGLSLPPRIHRPRASWLPVPSALFPSPRPATVRRRFHFFRKSIHQVTDPDLKKRIGLLGLNCAMTQKGSYAALEFLTVLQREFPRDPEVLYAAAHALSDLSLRASKIWFAKRPSPIRFIC